MWEGERTTTFLRGQETLNLRSRENPVRHESGFGGWKNRI
jgi:hypothetical protein